MKKIGNWPITEAETDFSKLQKMSTFLHSWTIFDRELLARSCTCSKTVTSIFPVCLLKTVKMANLLITTVGLQCILELTNDESWNDFSKVYMKWMDFSHIQSNWMDIGNCGEFQCKIIYAIIQCYGPITFNLGRRVFFYLQIRGLNPLSIHVQGDLKADDSTIFCCCFVSIQQFNWIHAAFFCQFEDSPCWKIFSAPVIPNFPVNGTLTTIKFQVIVIRIRASTEFYKKWIWNVVHKENTWQKPDHLQIPLFVVLVSFLKFDESASTAEMA